MYINRELQTSPIKASVDAGNGTTIVMTGNDRGVIYHRLEPSVIATIPQNDELPDYQFFYDDNWLVVTGRDVFDRRCHQNIVLQGESRYGSDYHVFLALANLVKSGIPDGAAIHLAVFLPPGLHTESYIAKMEKAFLGVHQISFYLAGEFHNITYQITDVIVLRETIDARYHFALDTNGSAINPHEFVLGGRVLLIDFGAYSREIILLVNGRHQAVGQQSSSLNAGFMQNVITPLLGWLRTASPELTAMQVSQAIMDAYEHDVWTINGINFKRRLNGLLDQYAEITYADIASDQLLNQLDRVILISGGATPMYKPMRRFFKNKLLSPSEYQWIDTVYTNASAGLRYLRYISQKE